MNLRANQLNMDNTNFKNPDGLDEIDHYTTLNDLLSLSIYILENTKLESHSSHTAFLLASETTTLNALIKKINVDLGIKLDALFENYNEESQNLRGIWEAAPKLKNWSPRINLNNGLQNYLGINNEF